MNARWVLHDPSPEMPTIGYTIEAKWWPGRYFLVMTFKCDSSSPLERLTQSIVQCVPYGEAVPGPDRYVTQVFRCKKDGAVHSIEKPLYKGEYSELSAARDGHKHIVESLEHGRKTYFKDYLDKSLFQQS